MANEYAHEATRSAFSPPEKLPHAALAFGTLMRDYLEGRGLSYDLACSNGWYPTEDREQGPAIVIPATRVPPWWQTRAMLAVPDVLRYKSAWGTRAGACIYTRPSGESVDGTLVIVEGPMDALLASQCGFPAVALCGKRPPRETWHEVAKICRAQDADYLRIILVPDLDDISVAIMWAHGLQASDVFFSIKTPCGYKDMGEMVTKGGWTHHTLRHFLLEGVT